MVARVIDVLARPLTFSFVLLQNRFRWFSGLWPSTDAVPYLLRHCPLAREIESDSILIVAKRRRRLHPNAIFQAVHHIRRSRPWK
jgi:hypothetical protein